MPNPVSETLAVLLLGATLACAVVRPRGLPEAVVAVPAAAVLLLLGVLPVSEARAETRSLAPTISFLAAVLVLAELCDRPGPGERPRGIARYPGAALGVPFLAFVLALGSS